MKYFFEKLEKLYSNFAKITITNTIASTGLHSYLEKKLIDRAKT